MSKKVRNTGFELPLNKYQVGSWAVTFLNLVMGSVIYMPTLYTSAQVIIK